MTAIRCGLLVLAFSALTATAQAGLFHHGGYGGGPFSPCRQPGWIGFSLALPVPRLPHLHTFSSGGCRSPLCGQGPFVGAGGCGLQGHGLFGHRGCGLLGHQSCGISGCGTVPYGGCGTCAPSIAPPVLSAPPAYSPPILPSAPTYSDPIPPAINVPLGLGCNPCQQAVPVASTHYVPRQRVSYRNVPQTQYRREAYTASVPVTTYQPVTKYRTVPFQTTVRVPQVTTQLVPQQRISYFQPAPVVASNPCTNCLNTPAMAYGGYNGLTNYAALPYSPAPIAMPQTATAPQPQVPAATLQPQIEANAQPWQTIQSRQAQAQDGIQQMGGFLQSRDLTTRERMARGPLAQPTPRKSLFRPAPSAAGVWQSRWLR